MSLVLPSTRSAQRPPRNTALRAHGVDSSRCGAEAWPGWVSDGFIPFPKPSALCSLEDEDTLWVINATAVLNNN